MKILTVETSSRHFSLAFSDGDCVIVEKSLVLDKILSDSIIPSVEEVLRKAKTPLTSLDGFAVGLGPGSFTSLRVGLATVKAFAFASGKPIVGIPSLDATAFGVPSTQKDICVIADARRNLVYACFYTKKNAAFKRKSEYLLCGLDEVIKKIKSDTVFVGDGVPLLKEKLEAGRKMNSKAPLISFAQEKFWYPKASALACLAARRFARKQFDNPDTLIPLYLYPDDCQVGKP